jgi:ubiquinone/menaquinone biosynthesis C-methylase UbiE/superfamily II DNA or RNA helicase
MQMPPQMVTQLREGRDFPDLGQLINIKEIEDKKRFVEADDMGLGKSAPPIFVKERQGIKTAIVVAPASVVNDPDTWQAYLSDKVGQDGKQKGYFREGMAPKVLVVNNVDQLTASEAHDYDYILVSQERLTKPYTEALLGIDYGMLIVDEAHKLKKLGGGVRAGNLLKLAEKVEGDDKYLVLLSGTPVPNKVEDVGMILKLLYPEQFKDINDKALVRSIIRGEYIDLRSLLMPRMQTKNIQDSLDLPPLNEEVVKVELSELEKEIYGILLEDDEIEAKEKIRILRQFLLNPDLLNVTPGVESSKIKALNADLAKKFASNDRVVVFFNDYIEGVLRGDDSVISKLELPEGVEVRVIHGDVSQKDREAIAQEFKTTNRKILLCVSGQTVEVGNDYSRGQAVDHYNDPWTRYRKNQQTGRVYREGVEGPITSTSFITEESIEEGIDIYTLAKFKAIEKLLKGIPITELEQGLLEKAEAEDESGLEVNPELAEYYFSAWDRMRKIFGYVKEIGEIDFKKFLQDFGQDYAQCYVDLGSRSYQANADRIVGTLIDQMAKEKGQEAEEVKILDVASGPEMLRRHIADDYQSRIVSTDINPLHFTENPDLNGEGSDKVVGSFLNLPFATERFDYANMSLAWHYANFVPSKDQTERLEVLRELHRVLKVGGRAIINSIYSLSIKDEDKLKEIAETVGFQMVPEYTGEATNGKNYQSTIYTFEKVHDLGWTTSEVMQLIGKENHDGLKFRRNDAHLRDTRRILSQFDFNTLDQDGNQTTRTVPVTFNQKDQQVFEEEQAIISQGEGLKTEYATIADIPRDVVIENNFIRVRLGKRYALFRRLQTAGGVVVIK